MTDVFRLPEIKTSLSNFDLIEIIEEGFVAYSQGKVVVPPVGELIFEEPPGDAHIKYGYIHGDDYFVIKIATGFYENAQLGIPTGNGLMLVFRQKTGELVSVLLDEGYLTDVRTAAAGAVAAKHLAPTHVECIGVMGAGVQGRLQLTYLASIVPCRSVMVWGISDRELESYASETSDLGYDVRTTREAQQVPESCKLIVTATPSKSPLLKAEWIRPGTHITAMGSDTHEKIELDPQILAQADIVVADSISQSKTRGEIFRATQAGVLNEQDLIELGTVIQNPSLRRQDDKQITVADLTGVAVQDIQIAKAVYENLGSKGNK
jgi:ornithine cyclodeaminase